MTKNLLVVVVAAIGCGNVSSPSMGDDVDPPDGGVPESDAGETPVDPMVLSIVPTPWKDERLDAIDFSTGEPVHTHQGAGVVIAAGGACPAAFHYAYLMDRAPAFGRQVTRNAMEIEVAVPTIPLDETASTYRVTTAGGSVMIPWTPIGAVPASGRVRVALHRDETPKLGTYEGELRFDVRVRDTAGVEQLVTACWMHHPMVAPIHLEPVQSALGPSSLTARVLSTPSHAIDVLTPPSSRAPAVYSARITQQTAEPVLISFAPAAPTGTYTSTMAYAYVPTATPFPPGNCEDYPASCDMSALPATTTTTASGALTTGVWSWTLVDEISGAQVPCSALGCEVPPRATGAAPRAYRLTVSGSGFSNLWQLPATLAALTEVTLPAGEVVGAWLTSNKITRCSALKTLNGVTVCRTMTEYTNLAALDRATLAMPALTMQVRTATSSIASSPVPYLPNGALSTPPVNWNGGDGPL